MFGGYVAVSPLASHKRLLVAESELNRARLIEDWQTMSHGVHLLAARAKSVSSIASAIVMLGAGLSVFRRRGSMSGGVKSSWLQMALQGAKMVASIWLALRSRRRALIRQK